MRLYYFIQLIIERLCKFGNLKHRNPGKIMYLLQLGLPLILQNMILWQICQKAWSLLASNVCKALAED